MRRLLPIWAACGVLFASGCAAGFSGPATDITSGGATLHGSVVSTTGGEGSYWFEWVVSRCCQGRTPTRTVALEKDRAFPVEEDFDAPVANAPYYYRLCAEDSENAGNPACGDVKTFNTAAP